MPRTDMKIIPPGIIPLPSIMQMPSKAQHPNGCQLDCTVRYLRIRPISERNELYLPLKWIEFG